MNRQRPGKAVQQIDSWVLLSPLQAAHVRSIYSSIERQTLLREAVPDPNAPQIPGYQCAPFHACRHAGRRLLNHWLYPVVIALRPCAKSSKNSKANRIETGETSGGIRRNLFGGSRRKIAKRSDALYPALSGEWKVPVTRNAKITPVNEGVGGGGGGPPLRDHLWQGPPLPVTLRLIHPPPKMTQGVMTP